MDAVVCAPGWTRAGDVAVRGRAFDGEVLLEGDSLAARFEDALEGDPTRRLERVAEVASGLEGFYGAVLTHGATAVLVADGARSVPLYYDAAGRVVSDRGGVVREAVDAECDPLTEREFLLTRYVTGPETVWEGVYATQPGEVVQVGEGGLERRTYREYWPSGAGAADPLEALRAGLECALERLECVAEGRPVVVPLSGGYDSRLLASALVERGLEVVAFTFGRAGHPDVEVSREVAARLGIRWEFLEYSAREWAEWYHGEACTRYRAWAFGGDALPFLAEWPAVRGLLEGGRLPRDGLYCPGHTVATPSERLPRFVGESGDGHETNLGCGPAVDADVDPGETATIEPSLEALCEYVLDTHYTLWEWEDDRLRERFAARIRRGLLGGREREAVSSPERAAAAYERWEWRGRMATFTNGDLRVYEDAGLEWWLPLWDPAYVRAWERVPVASRRGKAAHAALALECYERAADVPANRVSLTDRSLEPADRLLALLRYTPERQFTEHGGEWEPPFLTPRSRWGDRGEHPLAWDGVVHSDADGRLPPFRTLYSLRTLAETGHLDLDASGGLLRSGLRFERSSAAGTRLVFDHSRR
ncbi:asparagine synthase-related protein [Natronobiforma cellulositropha]|uniref:asparagine synthase-related protein n=1 Tax=Natronobiforma cellulositropha TaxID=1679076 RepID=UPI0021D5ECA6|nr:asparagine synthase-related protein [Natronobiforma cellulositropha]